MATADARSSRPTSGAAHLRQRRSDTKWVTIHDTAVDGNAPFNANALREGRERHAVQAAGERRLPAGHASSGSSTSTRPATPNATSPENDCCGGWALGLQAHAGDPSADTGKLRLFYKGDQAHAGFDNIAFLSRDAIAFVEDAGDTLHGQRNALDSGFVFDVTTRLLEPGEPAVALAGRGPRRVGDDRRRANAGFGKNDGDNEITGIHVSDGDPAVDGHPRRRGPEASATASWRWLLHAAARRQPDLGGREAVNHHRSAGGRCEAGSRPPGYAAPR